VVAASLVVPRSRIRAPIGLAHGPVPLPELTWRAFDALPPAGTGAEPAPLVALLERLAADGIVARSVAEDAHHSSPDPLLARLWPKIAERYEKQDSGIYTDLFSVATGASPRQIARAMRTLTGTVLLFGGFRESVRTLRLRRATMLLSAPSLRASEVARMVGYGSVDAMGRAFRDAGLPPPTTIRDHVCADPRDPVDTTSTRSSHR
jgi:AraC-like DNA-binding protein